MGRAAAGKPVDILLLHYTGMISEEGALTWLTSPQSQVSAHYFVGEDGRIVQMVDEAERAWHAGAVLLGRRERHQFALDRHRDRQSRPRIRLSQLPAGADRGGHRTLPRHSLPPCHPAPAGARPFGRGALAQGGPRRAVPVGRACCRRHRPLGHAGAGGGRPAAGSGDSGEAVASLKQRFRDYGYGLGPESVFDEETAAVVRAFQRHFRPAQVDGIADVSTVATLDRLIAALPRS